MSAARKRSPAAASAAQPLLKRAKTPVDLNEDALSLVMEFLAPKELYKMANTCKALRAAVSTRIVVRSAIMHGGNAKRTLSELYDLLKKDSIHMPSPLRLLRLVNGKQCEVCVTRKVNHANQGYGIFLCASCLIDGSEKHTVKITSARFRKSVRFQQIVEDTRTAGRWTRNFNQNNFHAFARPWIQNGESCGPRVTYIDYERIGSATERVENMMNELLPEQDTAAFVETYEASLEGAKAVDLHRKEQKKKAAKKAAESRNANVLQVVTKVQDLLEEPWSEFVLEHRETGCKGKRPSLKFSSPFCNELLKEYVTYPSKAKKSVIVDIVRQINDACRNISQRLLGFSFLPEVDVSEMSLKQDCLTNFPDVKSVMMERNANRQFFSLLSENKLLESVEHLKHREPETSCRTWAFSRVIR